MSPEQINIAIAEKCGWERWTNSDGTKVRLAKPDDSQRNYWKEIGGKIVGQEVAITEPIRGSFSWTQVPDYVNDLNEMHKVEKTLTPEQCNKYDLFLGCFELATDPPEKRHFHKTARQRAEAFLRTVGGWED